MMYGPLVDVKKKKIVLESLFDIPNFHLMWCIKRDTDMKY